jgi:hypothetical protein
MRAQRGWLASCARLFRVAVRYEYLSDGALAIASLGPDVLGPTIFRLIHFLKVKGHCEATSICRPANTWAQLVAFTMTLKTACCRYYYLWQLKDYVAPAKGAHCYDL